MKIDRQFLLYLAGPITGVSFGDCTDWRDSVAKKLPPHIIGVSPLRGKQFLNKESSIKDSYENHPLASQKGITVRDRFDVMRADAILVNLLGAKKVSIGTVMEIAWADLLRKPIIVAMEPENIHSHSMLRESSNYLVPTLEEATLIAITVLSPAF